MFCGEAKLLLEAYSGTITHHVHIFAEFIPHFDGKLCSIRRHLWLTVGRNDIFWLDHLDEISLILLRRVARYMNIAKDADSMATQLFFQFIPIDDVNLNRNYRGGKHHVISS